MKIKCNPTAIPAVGLVFGNLGVASKAYAFYSQIFPFFMYEASTFPYCSHVMHVCTLASSCCISQFRGHYLLAA